MLHRRFEMQRVMGRPGRPAGARLLQLALALMMALAAILPARGEAQAAAAETTPVWRLQVRLMTESVNEAGTDDDVMVSVNEQNATWLDLPHDDFSAGSTTDYDVLLTGVRTLADLKFLTISKRGTDALCLRSAQVMVNGKAIYAHSFVTAELKCRWLDGNNGYQPSVTIAGSTMRASSQWQAYTQPSRPTVLVNGDIERKAQIIMGHFMATSLDGAYAVRWADAGGQANQAVYKDARPLHVTFDLKQALDLSPDVSVTASFDLVFLCRNGRPSVDVSNLDYRRSRTWRLTPPFPSGLDTILREEFTTWVDRISPPADPRLPPTGCPEITIARSGPPHVTFKWAGFVQVQKP